MGFGVIEFIEFNERVIRPTLPNWHRGACNLMVYGRVNSKPTRDKGSRARDRSRPASTPQHGARRSQEADRESSGTHRERFDR
jgi:hypothetical protein